MLVLALSAGVILKGLIDGKFVFDVCFCFFMFAKCLFLWIDLTKNYIHEKKKSLEMCICL